MYTLNTVDRPAIAFQASGDRSNPGVSTSEVAYCISANPMSDRNQAVAFQQNQREEVRDMGEQAGAITAQPGVHNQNYIVYTDKARTLAARHDSSPCVGRGQNVICVQNTGRGWWNESEVAQTLRTPIGGDSTKANLVVYGVDCRNGTLDEEKTHTLQAKANGGISLNCTPSVVYDARGNGEGGVAPTLTGDHESRITDYTAILVERKDE